jgi:transcriptional regulator with XRE-family HTH domain
MYLKRIKELREDNDLYQKDICKILNLKQPHYARYETGKRDFPAEYIVKLAQFYNVSTDYIFELTDNPKPYNKK